jgi:hypothetical protein
MTRVACLTCRRFFAPKRIGVYAEECFEDGGGYKVWAADLLACPGCGTEVLAGFGAGPIAEHYQDGYAATRARLQPIPLDGFA